jgi:diaminopimelate decarboxylase
MPFELQAGVLSADGVALDAVARAVGTPLYVYSASAMEERLERFRAAVPDGSLVAFAVKANPNLGVIATLARRGAGADVVSGGELLRATTAGVDPKRIVFSGVGKTLAEIEQALRLGICQLNAESEPELEMISAVAERLGTTAPVALRVNPEVVAGTHDKISTGRREDKFGIPIARAGSAAALAASLPGLRLQGLALHIGSQLTRLPPFEAAFATLLALAAELRAAGHAIETLDLGGGVGVPYVPGEPPPPPIEDYGALVRRLFAGDPGRLIFEPGRFLVAEAGVLLAQVILVKEGADRRFVVIDAAMNDLMRPTLYGAFHHIRAVRPRGGTIVADIVGPACETGDTFGRERDMDQVGSGDLVAIMTAGAYGATMASTYNSRALVPEVLLKDGRWAVVAERVLPERMIALESVPDWLREPAPAAQANAA